MQKSNKRLLIVDDDKQIRELLVFDIAQSGQFANKIAKKHPLSAKIISIVDCKTNVVFIIITSLSDFIIDRGLSQ